MEFISEHLIPTVVAACLSAGYVIKKSFDFIPNKYIPTILVILGAVLACISASTVTLDNIVYGAVSGLMSIGLHQTFKHWIEGESDR